MGQRLTLTAPNILIGEPFMLMGADVTHLGPSMQGGSGSSIAKSVAAVVASRELFLMRNNINCEAMQYPLPSRDSSKCALQVNKKV